MVRWSLLLVGLVLNLLVLGWGCTSPNTVTGDAGNYPGPDTSKPPTGKVDLTVRLPDGQVRAGVIETANAFIGGPNSQEAVGDIKLYNSKAAFTISGNRVVHGYMPFGGKVVAADVIRPKGEPGQSLFQEFSMAFEHRMMKPEKVELVNDGRDGKAAVLRITGKDEAMELLQSYIKAASQALVSESRPLGFEITNEYRLEPDSPLLEIRTIVKNKGDDYQSIRFAEIGFFMGDGLLNVFPGKGVVGTRDSTGFWPYHGLAGEKVGYVLFPKQGQDFQVIFRYKAVMIAFHEAFDLNVGEETSFTWYLAVGQDLAGAQAAYRRAVPGPYKGALRGKVVDPKTDEPKANVRIHIEQRVSNKETAYIGQAVSQADGSYTIELPVGVYTLRTQYERMVGEVIPVTITAAGQSMTLKAPQMGTLLIEAKEEGSQEALPVKVTVRRKDKAISIPSRYGVDGYSGSAIRIFYPYGGSGSASLPPGRYQVIVSRGLFYEYHSEDVTITSGQETTVKATLKRSVDTTGIISGDFHVHAKGSPDSNDSNELKVAAMAGEGLELAVSTDHEFITDYQPVIQKMKLTRWIRGVIGEEITTYFGHFNAYPLPIQTDKTNQGALHWYAMDAPKLFDLVYKTSPDAVLQINHPRGVPAGAYFSYVGYDPEVGKATFRPEKWSTKFDAIEVVNGSFSKAERETMPDWFSMLNRGQRVTATGNSDSHNAYTSECGYPRNLVMTGSSDIQKYDQATFSKAIKEGRLVVSGGAMIHFGASSTGVAKDAVKLGDLLTLQDDKVHLHVRIEAASWVPLDRLRIVANGKVVLTKTIPASKQLVRFDESLSLTPQKDTWYIVIVDSKKNLSPVIPGATPFAFTNPIYVDVNKDKKFTASLSSP